MTLVIRLCAVVGGLATYVALGLMVRAEPGPATIDRRAFDAIAPLRTDRGIEIVRVLTDIGYGPAAVAVTLIGALVAVARGRLLTALALVIGTALLFAAVPWAKDFWGRPRPEGMLAPAGGLSYPSGHAAYAMAWVAAAVVIGRRGLMVVALAVVVFVMFSRLYLGVHFLTDVVGGVALAVAVYGMVLRR